MFDDSDSHFLFFSRKKIRFFSLFTRKTIYPFLARKISFSFPFPGCFPTVFRGRDLFVQSME
ncbi:hypothetical protein CH362_14450 [Leptospira saintgironsiae]|uniref:Uncharacterized protein n=1 Tax=Leptospira saintgironsiae TaxID=2023183 RepID=A0A2M9Y9Z2_9LEPT|nr:hypothetical protein CH362_14450 [Leptospira saintgironsiae]